MHVYINYPNPRIAIHYDSSCGFINMHEKEEQRRLAVTPANQEKVIDMFISRKYILKPQKRLNGFWLDISLKTREQEIAFLQRVLGIMGRRYRPLKDAPVSIHCGDDRV